MQVQGTVADGFEPVRDVYAEVVAGSTGTGSSLAVWHDGAWVVDLWGGWADASRSRRWRPDTLVMPYSVTKPLTAACVLLLADRGLVDIESPMARYWPELPGGATVRQVLDHSAGHVLLGQPAPVEAFYDWDLMSRLVERQQPMWTPGDGVGESALLYGHLLGEVVRRVDGRSLGTFLREEVTGPLGLDFHIGVPERDLGRVADLTGLEDLAQRRTDESTGLMDRALGNPPGALDGEVVNGTAWRRAEVPAVNGHGTARSVAGFYVALNERRLLSEPMLAELRTPSATGYDVVVGTQREWGLGVAIDPDGWGMGGTGGSFGWWSAAGRYASAFLTGDVSDPDRGDRLENAFRDCLGLPPA